MVGSVVGSVGMVRAGQGCAHFVGRRPPTAWTIIARASGSGDPETNGLRSPIPRPAGKKKNPTGTLPGRALSPRDRAAHVSPPASRVEEEIRRRRSLPFGSGRPAAGVALIRRSTHLDYGTFHSRLWHEPQRF